MSQPVPYSRQYNFTNYQAVSPSQPLPAAQVDLELNSVKATMDQILNNLALIQRDDTALANKSVGLDQLKAEVSVGVNAPTSWVTAHSYVVRDTVFTAGIFYQCLVSHTSGTFATDLAAAKWSLIADFTSISFDLAAATHAAGAKTVPNDADEFSMADSASVWVLKKWTWANLKATFYSAFGALIGAGTTKSTPIDADAVALMDSAAGNATKTVTFANFKAQVLAGFGAFMLALTGKSVPVGADSLLISDSAAAGVPKVSTLTQLFASIFAALGPLIAAATVKSTPVGGDSFVYSDSAAAGATKYLTWTNILAALAGTFAKLTGAQTLTGGFDVTAASLGTMGNFTAAPQTHNLQYGTNNAAFTLTAPASDCAMNILVTNGASAGAITFSGFSVGTSTGDAYALTNTNKYFLQILRINGVSTYRWAACQ